MSSAIPEVADVHASTDQEAYGDNVTLNNSNGQKRFTLPPIAMANNSQGNLFSFSMFPKQSGDVRTANITGLSERECLYTLVLLAGMNNTQVEMAYCRCSNICPNSSEEQLDDALRNLKQVCYLMYLTI